MKKIKTETHIIRIKILILAGGLFFSCNDFTDVGPPKTEVVSDVVFTSDAASLSAISGIYSMMIGNNSFSNVGIELYTGTAADELISYSATDVEKQFYINSVLPLNTTLHSYFWLEPYKYIFNANVAIEGLETSRTLSPNVKAQLTGEAKFIRAFCFFYLTNLFGEVPLTITSDYRSNSTMNRTPSPQVYRQIIEDLVWAEHVLPVDFGFTSGERVRATSWAATALLARAYLYSGDWANAEESSSKVISASLFSLPTDLKTVFLKNSAETIWQLKPVIPSSAIRQASTFVLTTAPTRVSLSPNLVQSMESGDRRRTDWIGTITTGGNTYYYAFKYRNNISGTLTEYNTVLRLAEQYLIRAEARTQQGNLSGGLADLNLVRARAGLAGKTTADKGELLSFIEKERRVELFTEWGHRWLDLKRTDRASVILQPLKVNWTDTDVLFPIPQTEINVNPALLPQNAGY